MHISAPEVSFQGCLLSLPPHNANSAEPPIKAVGWYGRALPSSSLLWCLLILLFEPVTPLPCRGCTSIGAHGNNLLKDDRLSRGLGTPQDNRDQIKVWDKKLMTLAVSAADLQQVIVVLQLKVGENQGNGVSWLGQHRPGAVSVVVVLGRVIGSGDHPALAPQCPATPIIRCREQRRRTVM
ncbi:hypothetical protein F7725_024841 [Dissostichus mawsoni]|uniref:Uncharacterized protein n=1 Tax=Dissostichus mawsoni TaxID=36200 RepID=A0A7J5XAI4_DISMA|nr:hypothetical protein F7725_024841 [Dissostichus mawsoni]